MFRTAAIFASAILLLSSCTANYQAYTNEKISLMRLKLSGKITQKTYDYRMAQLYKKYYGGSSYSSSSRRSSGSSSKPASKPSTEPASAPIMHDDGVGSSGSNYSPVKPSTGDPAMGNKKPQPSVLDVIKDS